MQRGQDAGRRDKRVRVLHALRRSPGLSKVALARELGISPGTVRLVTDELFAAGLVVTAGRDLTTGGRPSGQLALNSSSPLALGVDLGEVEMRLGLLNLVGELVSQRRTPFDRRHEQVSVDQIAGEINALRASAEGTVAGVGLGVPGHLDLSAGRVLYAANLGWRDVELRDRLSEAVGLPVLMDRNTNSAMLAEQWWGPAFPTGPALFVTLGSGIGVAIRVNGLFLRGAGGAAGEFGHLVIDKRGPECACGQRGCLEAMASGRAVQRRYNQLSDESPDAGNISELIRAARADDPAARRALAEAADHLADGLATLVNLLNPSTVVLGGELMAAEAELLPVIRDGIRRKALSYSAAQVEILPSSLRDEGPLIGSASMVFDAVFNQRISLDQACRDHGRTGADLLAKPGRIASGRV
jgi:predicted NBD/HSP70 family sugar kinase